MDKHGHQDSQQIFQPKLHSHYYRLLLPTKHIVTFLAMYYFTIIFFL